MLRSKSFVKRTRRGGVIKVVREHYLRDDVWCGSKACTKCDCEDPPLPKSPDDLRASIIPEDHYILPDANIILHQSDLISHASIKNLIIVQTVLNEVKNRNITLYNRLRELITDKNKQCYVFTNEHHRGTYSERNKNETANDYNDRCIRKACDWYNKHLEKSGIKTVLLTNDQDCRSKARNEGLPAFSAMEYFESVEDVPELLDLLAAPVDEDNDVSNEVKYQEYITKSEMQIGLKSGRLHQGSFQRSRTDYREGTIKVDSFDQAVLLKGLQNCNRAINDDIVVIAILDESEWSEESNIVATEDTTEDTKEVKEVESKQKEKPRCGQVVGIVKRNWRPYCGMLLPSHRKGITYTFQPADKMIPRVKIRTRQGESLQGKRIIVNIDGWTKNARSPYGHFVRCIGKIGDKAAENEVILIEHGVPYHEFSDKVKACLPQMPWGLTETDTTTRADYRGLDVCSIDPPGCTDIDDALHIRELESGNFEVGVHIADVTHFVKADTAMDLEARDRGTTVYLTDKRIDMLPELLGSNLCSLRSKVDRLAFSVLWEMSPQGEIIDVKFTKSIIQSKFSFTYAEAQSRIDDKSMVDSLTNGLRQLNKFAQILKAKRIEDGALSLASPEVRFQFDADDERHDPLDVEVKKILETNSLVEEFMLLANTTVATRITEHFTESACLRRHPVPAQGRFETLIRCAKTIGIELDTSTSKHLADSLDNAIKPDFPYVNTLLRILTTRCMMQAVYFSSGTIPESEYFHYGLAAPVYTHFTSPIRRYADIFVHRMLAVAIGWDVVSKELISKESIESACDNLNRRHRAAQFAGRSSVELYTHIFFRNKVVQEEAYVIRVCHNAIVVIVPKYGIEGTIFLQKKESKREKNLDSDIEFDADNQALKFSVNDKTYEFKTFDHLIVQISVDQSDVQHETMCIKLVSPDIEGISVPSLLKESVDATTSKRIKLDA